MKNYCDTYCNPISIPDYPIGRDCLDGKHMSWREAADPTVIYENGIWYLYPSCGMVYYTDDFREWKHVRMEPYDCGYAPTVVKSRGKFLLCASVSELWESSSPTGPFKPIGKFRNTDGTVAERIFDPMLFSDDDERLYLYWCTGVSGVIGAELDADNPIQMISEPTEFFRFDPSHEWERCGDYNDDGGMCSMEGAWLYKKHGVYYLCYSAPGTEFISYAQGAYKGDRPLGPFTYMKSSPFTRKTSGLCRGVGHGCIVDGPCDTIWTFYTIGVWSRHHLERRIGMDPLGIDENGDLYVKNISETPQWIPGLIKNPENDNGAGLKNCTGHRSTSATSHAAGRDALYAVDGSTQTWWQPDAADTAPTLTVSLAYRGIDIKSVRIMWRDVGLDVCGGVTAGAFGYTVDAMDTDNVWHEVLAMSDNKVDMAVDYRVLEPMRARAVRLNIKGTPEGITPGVIDFTVFGEWTPAE